VIFLVIEIRAFQRTLHKATYRKAYRPDIATCPARFTGTLRALFDYQRSEDFRSARRLPSPNARIKHTGGVWNCQRLFGPFSQRSAAEYSLCGEVVALARGIRRDGSETRRASDLAGGGRSAQRFGPLPPDSESEHNAMSGVKGAAVARMGTRTRSRVTRSLSPALAR